MPCGRLSSSPILISVSALQQYICFLMACIYVFFLLGTWPNSTLSTFLTAGCDLWLQSSGQQNLFVKLPGAILTGRVCPFSPFFHLSARDTDVMSHVGQENNLKMEEQQDKRSLCLQQLTERNYPCLTVNVFRTRYFESWL
jgi:hypothetical protein